MEGIMITGLRFVERDGKRILQACGRDILGFSNYENPDAIGLGAWIEWQDVPLVEATNEQD